MNKPVVHIIDDDPAVAQAITIVAKSLGYIVSSYKNAEAFLYGYDEHSQGSGCILLDVKMPGIGGMKLQQMLDETGVKLPIIMMSGHADIPMVVEVMKRGAVTFLEKPFRVNMLTEEIEKAIQLDAQLRVERSKAEDAKERFSRLTEKEREVLILVQQGMTNREMAKHLGLTVRAIEDRRARLMRKLEVKTLPEMLTLLRYDDSLIPKDESESNQAVET